MGEKERVCKINEMILQHKELGGSTKDISDKWHTFEELYYHRMILFLTIQKAFPHISWKSKQHHDGTMFEDSFIVGIETPEGQYSYHYNLKYWSLFKNIVELDRAPEYDGHKPEDIDRLFSLFRHGDIHNTTKDIEMSLVEALTNSYTYEPNTHRDPLIKMPIPSEAKGSTAEDLNITLEVSDKARAMIEDIDKEVGEMMMKDISSKRFDK